MCGISGIVGRKGERPKRELIEKMVATAQHRGPDGSGVYESSEVLLGHNRLAILDLSNDGHQPMSTDDGNLTITYNGEIYNYIELRAELERLGYQFRSRSDTEVLLKAYQAWGEEALSRCNGMWGFVIHDRRRQILFGARDRFGVKPLYYQSDSEHFLFASEIKQILSVKPPEGVEEQAVSDYLFASLLDHNEVTFFKGIRRLLAGHCFTYDLKSGKLTIRRWYELRPREPKSDALEGLRELLVDSVRLRLRSDVRVGTCLSGGLDSSTIASLASPLFREASGQKFFSITASSLDPASDETIWAQKVIEAADLEGHFVRPNGDEFLSALRATVEDQEEPFNSLSIFMQAFVMRRARELGVKVLLDGQGGDEVLLGYPKYYQAALFDSWRFGGLGAIQLWRDILRNNRNLGVSGLVKLAGKGFATRMRWLGPIELRGHAAQDWKFRSDDLILSYREGLSSVAKVQRMDLQMSNLPQLLRYEDKNSMRHSIETRLPFLDYRVVEYGLGLSLDEKMRDGWSKAPLRRLMHDRLPEDLLWRRDKVGFAAPDRLWQRAFPKLWREWVIGNSLIEKIFPKLVNLPHPDVLRSEARWKIINLAIWHRVYFDRSFQSQKYCVEA